MLESTAKRSGMGGTPLPPNGQCLQLRRFFYGGASLTPSYLESDLADSPEPVSAEDTWPRSAASRTLQETPSFLVPKVSPLKIIIFVLSQEMLDPV